MIDMPLLDACCRFSTPSLQNPSTMMRISCVFLALGKLNPGLVILFLCWKETGIVFQSPKVPSKSNWSLMRSCSNFFEDWRLDAPNCFFDNWLEICFFLSLVSSICAHLVPSCVLISSLAKLSFSFCMQSVLAFHRWLMFSLARLLHQWLSSWLLKSIAIPISFMI